METEASNANLKFDIQVALKYSLILALCYVTLFSTAKMMGFAQIINIRLINYVFAFIFCYKAIDKVYASKKYTNIYFTGIRISIFTAAFAQFGFAFLLFIYLNFDHSFAHYLVTRMPWDIVMPEFSVSLLFFAEGLAISIITSIILIQYFEWKRRIH